MLQRRHLGRSASRSCSQALVERQRRHSAVAAAGPAPALPQAPQRTEEAADPRTADSSSSQRHHKPLRLGRSTSIAQRHRRRRSEPTNSVDNLQQRQPQQPLQPQPQLPWDRHDQCTDNASDLATGPAASTAVAAMPPAHVAVQPLPTSEAPTPAVATSAAVAAEAAALEQAAAARLQEPKAARRIRQPKESDQERQRRLRRQALSESYWRAQVDLSTGFPVPLGYAPVRSRAELVQQSWQAADRHAAAQYADVQVCTFDCLASTAM